MEQKGCSSVSTTKIMTPKDHKSHSKPQVEGDSYRSGMGIVWLRGCIFGPTDQMQKNEKKNSPAHPRFH